MQDIYNTANSKFGLKRGEEKSKTLVDHTTLKDYRELIKQDLEEEKEFYNELSKIFWILHQGKFYWFRKKYSAEEVKEIASATFKS